MFDFVLSYKQVVHGYAYESKAHPPKKEFAGNDTVIGFIALPEKNDIAGQLHGKPYESFLEEQMHKLMNEVNHNNKAITLRDESQIHVLRACSASDYHTFKMSINRLNCTLLAVEFFFVPLG